MVDRDRPAGNSSDDATADTLEIMLHGRAEHAVHSIGCVEARVRIVKGDIEMVESECRDIHDIICIRSAGPGRQTRSSGETLFDTSESKESRRIVFNKKGIYSI